MDTQEMGTMEYLRGLSEDDLAMLPYMIKAEQQRRIDAKRIERMVNHQCQTLEEIRSCPICCIP
jgi:hypothetical protein